MVDYFPDYYSWKEGDGICYLSPEGNQLYGKLVAISNDSIIVNIKLQYSERKNIQLYGYQIVENTEKKRRDEQQKFEEFHKDILPSITDENNFPNLSTKLLASNNPDPEPEEVDVETVEVKDNRVGYIGGGMIHPYEQINELTKLKRQQQRRQHDRRARTGDLY